MFLCKVYFAGIRVCTSVVYFNVLSNLSFLIFQMNGLPSYACHITLSVLCDLCNAIISFFHNVSYAILNIFGIDEILNVCALNVLDVTCSIVFPTIYVLLSCLKLDYDSPIKYFIVLGCIIIGIWVYIRLMYHLWTTKNASIGNHWLRINRIEQN